MSQNVQPILVFGATGQQGGAVAKALLHAGRPVRVFVRDPRSERALALARAGAEIAVGSLDDADAVRAAMRNAVGVFSVQPSSPDGTVTDEDEVRYGVQVADLAAESGARHLVYSSAAAVGAAPTGVGHFDSKARIEAHVRTLPIAWTIVRPATFMEMLAMPGLGLEQGRFSFFPAPDQSMQLIAVEDVGRIVADVFADPVRYSGATFEVAGDMVTGRDLARHLMQATGRPIAYSRFPDGVLDATPLLAKLTALLDAGPLAGHADIASLRRDHPGLQTIEDWLRHDGRAAFATAPEHADGRTDPNR